MSKVNSSEFSVVDVRVTAIVVITVPSPVAVTALSLDYECVICVFVMGDSNNWKNKVLSQFRGNFINKHSYNYIFISLIFS